MNHKLSPELQAIADSVKLPAGLDVALSVTDAGAVNIRSDAMRCDFYVSGDALLCMLESLADEFTERSAADEWDCEASQFDKV